MPKPKLGTDEACAPSPHTATELLGLQQTTRVFWNRSSCRDNLARSMGFRFGPVVGALPVGRLTQIFAFHILPLSVVILAVQFVRPPIHYSHVH